MKKLRLFPFVIIGFNVLIGLVMLAGSDVKRGPIGFLAFNLFFLAIASLGYWRQNRAVKAAVDDTEQVLRSLANTAFDEPASVEPKFESSLVGAAGVLGPGGTLAPVPGFTVTGRVDGVRTKIASGTSIGARQAFELYHTYSYVTVDAENAVGKVCFVGRDSYFKWGKLLGDIADHKLGDSSFDEQWVVAGDPEIARALIDAPLRAELTALQRRAHAVSSVGMSIQLTGEGLVVRFPGRLDAQLATTLRDLALRLRKRLFETLRSQGLLEADLEAPLSARVRVDGAASTRPNAQAEAEVLAEERSDDDEREGSRNVSA
jgi:hypothetical protein